MIDVLYTLFTPIMWFFYDLSGNWWVAIFLFTVVAKAVQFPLSLWSDRNGLAMVEFMPDLLRLKAQFFGDREAIEERQTQLYKERHYHPMLAIVPLAFQIVILIGLIGVISDIAASGLEGTEVIGLVPYSMLEDNDWEVPFDMEGAHVLWMPVLAGLSAVLLGITQNRMNPLQREQTRREQLLTNGLSVAIAVVLGVYVTAGVAFYWVCSNVLAIPVQALCNVVFPPRKFVDRQAIDRARAELAAIEEAAGGEHTRKHDPNAQRERDDYERFFTIRNKHLVFYSEGSGFYRYYRGAIEWLLAHSDVWIHYITKDPDDQVFELARDNPRIFPYYIGERKLITLFMKLEADVVVLSTPELDNYYLKRSYMRSDMLYVFVPHHTTSMHLVAGSKNAYDHFDAVLCVGPHQVAELRRLEELNGSRAKRLFETGYDLLDTQIADYEAARQARGGEEAARQARGGEEAARVVDGAQAPDSATVLVAPSWAPDNILDTCIDELLEQLLQPGRRVVVRPHPEYVKRYRARWDALAARWAHLPADRLAFEGDFRSNASVLSADVVVTDWSSIPLEFCFTTLRPALYVDTPMKVANPDWEQVGLEPVDIAIRNQIGRSVDPGDMSGVNAIVDDMLRNADAWRDRICEARGRYVFNLGCGGAVAGEQLLGLVLEQQEKRGR